MRVGWRHVLALIAIEAVVIALCALIGHAGAQEHRHPGETITGATAQFYETWKRPDMPDVSCCDKKDCYATPSRHRGGRIQALHRESGEWIDIPPDRVELNRDSPDGLSHLCASASQFVYCFKEGGGT